MIHPIHPHSHAPSVLLVQPASFRVVFDNRFTHQKRHVKAFIFSLEILGCTLLNGHLKNQRDKGWATSYFFIFLLFLHASKCHTDFIASCATEKVEYDAIQMKLTNLCGSLEHLRLRIMWRGSGVRCRIHWSLPNWKITNKDNKYT